MNAHLRGLLLVGMMMIVSFISQLRMRMLSNQMTSNLPQLSRGLAIQWAHLATTAFGCRLLFVVTLVGILFLLWLLTLMRLELSIAPTLASIATVVNAVGAGLVLREAMTLTEIAGIVAVAVGIGPALKT
jgi:drug/metabolite transporter (DMT)-like permease